jgi:hypothetical protein
MGTNLLTGVAPQAGLIAQSSHQTISQSSRSVEGNVAQNQVVQQFVTSGAASNPAAVVSLSSGGKGRAASYGEGKGVDASFDNQATEEHEASDGSTQADGKKKSAVNVTA